MTTSTIHTDVIGTTYTNAQANILKLKAVRKLIVKSDVVTTAGIGYETIIDEMKAESGSSPNMTTQLGPIYNNPNPVLNDDGSFGDPVGQVSGAAIVHPSNNDCFLQTVDVAVLGDQRYLITAQYGVTQGFGGGGSSPNTTCQFRASTRARRVYDTSGSEGGYPLLDVGSLGLDASPVKFSDMQTIPVLKVQVPFYLMNSPVGPATYTAIGGLNEDWVTFNGQQFDAGFVRFDGVQMDEYGGAAVGGNRVAYKYRGFYEFTVDSVGFLDQRPVVDGGAWVVKSVQSNVTGNSWLYGSLWYD